MTTTRSPRTHTREANTGRRRGRRLSAAIVGLAAAAATLALPARPAQAKCLERHTGWQVGADGTLEYVLSVCAAKSYFGSDSSLWFYLSTSSHDNQWGATGEYAGEAGPPKAKTTSGADAEKRAALAETPEERAKRNAQSHQMLEECRTPLSVDNSPVLARLPLANNEWLPPKSDLRLFLDLAPTDPRYNAILGELQTAVAIWNQRVERAGVAALPITIATTRADANVVVDPDPSYVRRKGAVATALATKKAWGGYLQEGALSLGEYYSTGSPTQRLEALVHEIGHLNGLDHEEKRSTDTNMYPSVTGSVALTELGVRCDLESLRQWRESHPQTAGGL